jgi:hypothetical protein
MSDAPVRAVPYLEDPDNDRHQKLARRLVAKEVSVQTNSSASPEDFYVVMFAYILGGWKALISTDVVDNLYWELTYNTAKREVYLDQYTKQHNRAISVVGL